MPSRSTLAKTSFPSGPGTWFSDLNPSRSTQNGRHGSTLSTTSTGVRRSSFVIMGSSRGHGSLTGNGAIHAKKRGSAETAITITKNPW